MTSAASAPGSRDNGPGCRWCCSGTAWARSRSSSTCSDHSWEVDAAVLTGTAVIDLLEPALDLDQPLDLSDVQRPVRAGQHRLRLADPRRGHVDAYVADPLCGFGLDPDAAKQMFEGARALADPAEVATIRPDLPVYIAAGELDPVNGGLTLLTPLADRLKEAAA